MDMYQVRPDGDRYVVRGRQGRGSAVSVHDTREVAQAAADRLNGHKDARDEQRRTEKAREQVVAEAMRIVRAAEPTTDALVAQEADELRTAKRMSRRCPGCGIVRHGRECPECGDMG